MPGAVTIRAHATPAAPPQESGSSSETGRAAEHVIPDGPPVAQLVLPAGWRLASIDYWTPDLRLDDGACGSLFFLLREDVADFRDAVEVAIAEWIATGAWSREHAPNWGDAYSEVPEEIWLRHGLLPFNGFAVAESFQVDHDVTFQLD